MLRLARHWPDAGRLIVFSVLWALALDLSLLAGLWLRIGLQLMTLPQLAMLFTLGGLCAAGPALMIGSALSGRMGGAGRFLTLFLVLGLVTFVVTAGLFALQYRHYYAQWHAPFGSRIWAFQFVFTSASAVYQFAIFCLGHGFFALGPLALASLWFARRQH